MSTNFPTLFEHATDVELLTEGLERLIVKARSLKVIAKHETASSLWHLYFGQHISPDEKLPTDIPGLNRWQKDAREKLADAIFLTHEQHLPQSYRRSKRSADQIGAWREQARVEGFLLACECALRHRVESAAAGKRSHADDRRRKLIEAVEPFRLQGMGRLEAATAAFAKRTDLGKSVEAVRDAIGLAYVGRDAWKNGLQPESDDQ